MEIGKQNWKYGKEGIRNLSSVTNVVRHMDFNKADFVSTQTANGIVVSLRGQNADTDDKMTFKCTLSGTNNSTVSVTAGTISFGETTYDVATTTLTLTSAIDIIYVYHAKDHSSSGINHSSSYPTSGGSEWRWALATFALNGTEYELYKTNHTGDVVIAMAI